MSIAEQQEAFPMAGPLVVSKPSYSLRLVRPFLRLLRAYPAVPTAALDDLERRDPDERVATDLIHELLSAAIFLTGDEEIGLKAARELGVGALGALEYAAGSAPTLREAINVIARYMYLLNDGLDIKRELEGERFVIRLDNATVFPRAAEDFALAAFNEGVKQRYRDIDSDYEVHFRHPPPKSAAEYRTTFPRGTLRFASSFTGFVLHTADLDRPVPTHDDELHVVIRRHADHLLSELPKVETLTDRVRHRLLEQLGQGESNAPRIAKALGVSQRTLNRKLGLEGTSYKALFDEARKELAVRYTTASDLPFSEIGRLLGFSDAAAFTRAFKRWTGVAPIEYRRTHGR